ncbi:MAG TPA: hypothetical protein PLU30_12655 [Verrucomicrobiae bacterium]|nr:hypothetical protein [Verrucomicrobiae bacterium]
MKKLRRRKEVPIPRGLVTFGMEAMVMLLMTGCVATESGPSYAAAPPGAAGAYVCTRCNGPGTVCGNCGGKGWVVQESKTQGYFSPTGRPSQRVGPTTLGGPTMYYQAPERQYTRVTCPGCGGNGCGGCTCPQCQGSGRVWMRDACGNILRPAP